LFPTPRIKNEAAVNSLANRRKSARKGARFRFNGLFGDSKTPFRGITVNMSCSGFLLNSSVLLTVGTRAYIKMSTFVDGVNKDVCALVNVRHSSISNNEYFCGVEIVEAKKADLLFISKYALGFSPHK
jgi:hypothetical protein